MKRRILLFFSFLLLTISLQAQTKFEREYRLDANDVPLTAKEYLTSLGATKKIKWYKEISQTGKSIEGKTKINNACYSVEFDTTGVLEDVEIKIGWKEIAPQTQGAIRQYLEKEFDKFSFQKIQRQFVGKPEIVQLAISSDNPNEAVTISYEMVVKGRKNRKVKLYEFLFSQDGNFIESLPIELRNTDNLEY